MKRGSCKACGRPLSASRTGWAATARANGFCCSCWYAKSRGRAPETEPRAKRSSGEALAVSMPSEYGGGGGNGNGRSFALMGARFAETCRLVGKLDAVTRSLSAASGELLERSRRLVSELQIRVTQVNHANARMAAQVRESNAELRRQVRASGALRENVRRALHGMPAVPRAEEVDPGKEVAGEPHKGRGWHARRFRIGRGEAATPDAD